MKNSPEKEEKKFDPVAELAAAENDPADDIAPEATKFHAWINGERKLIADPEERNKLTKRHRNAHFRNFYKFIAREFPHLIFEKDNEHQYFLYDEKTGLYEDLSDVFIKELVTRKYIEEGFAHEGKVGEVRQCLLRLRSIFVERGVKLEDFDNHEEWFHCSNGWIHVDTREFAPQSPERLSRFAAEVAYDKDATALEYEKMMASFGLPDDQVRVLHQFSGLTLTGDIRQQKMLVLLGRPGCGKSTVVEIWRRVLGKLSIVKSLTTFSNEGAVRFIGGSLIGKTLIHFDEADIKRSELGAHISNLITGDVIDVERKAVQGNVDVSNRLKCILSANKLPPGQDGIFRRMILIKFEKSFTDDMTADRKLPEKLRAESSGILNRMLDGLADLRKMDGFTTIDGHDDLIEEYKTESDIMAEFMDTFFDPVFTSGAEQGTGGVGIPSTVMYQTYKKWADDNGVGSVLRLTPQKFGRMLSNVSLNKFAHVHTHKGGAGARYWRGVKPKHGVILSNSGEVYIQQEQLTLDEDF
jgi:P4 family phage/plasmid primase-like protien